MAKIEADRDTCAGYANCVMAAEDYFALDPDGTVRVTQSDVDAGDEENVAEAVESCPVAALRLVG